ncbi:hypothetical protein F4774DRAFT_394944 [Daldinia eschscholtzii]|nr:hypothetical protein F4774DRAFT_394944 [Daldinia eschscholtzii]
MAEKLVRIRLIGKWPIYESMKKAYGRWLIGLVISFAMPTYLLNSNTSRQYNIAFIYLCTNMAVILAHFQINSLTTLRFTIYSTTLKGSAALIW